MKKRIIPLILLGFTSTCLISACGGSADETSSTPAPQPVNSSTPTASETPAETTTTKAVDGEKIFKRCATCHTLEEGGNSRTGPNLYGIFGATAGTNPDFGRYSSAMKESGIVWDDETMGAYLKNPRQYVPGTNMSFAGLRKDEQIAAVISYMKEKTTP